MKSKRTVTLKTPADVIEGLGGPLAVAKANRWGRSRVGNWARLKAFPGRVSIRILVMALAQGLKVEPSIFNTTKEDLSSLRRLLAAA